MPQSTISLVVHDRTFVSDRHSAGTAPEPNQARRFALGQAMRTHGPLARNNVAVSLRRDDASFFHVRHAMSPDE